VAESLTEESVSERHERARKTRYVSVTATENGMCLLRARLPLIEGKAIADRLRKQGKALIKARPKPANAKPTGTSATSGGTSTDAGTSAASAGATGTSGATGASRTFGTGGGVADAEAHVVADASPHADAAKGGPEVPDAPDAPEVPDVPDAPDERTMDEVKADLFADMLLTSDPMSCAAAAGIQASVQFTIPILTALTKLGGSGAGSSASASRVGGATRLTPAPALLDGMIPIPLEDAIRLAGTATSFVRILTHPITGTVEAVDTYRPTAAMRAYLTARDIHCRWPGCRQPAATCDLDHTHAWEHGGTTTLENLCGLCRHHHVMKHATAWTATQLPGGVMQLRTPSGKTITDRPEHHDVHFSPNDENTATASSPQNPAAETELFRVPAPDDAPGDPPPF
uniref:HNH endonuclease signature motif containing protein n=1 Tax=Pseudoclavibacter helvolus TaxID=255205 RepID=UPI003735C530